MLTLLDEEKLAQRKDRRAGGLGCRAVRVRPILVEPMPAAGRAAARPFGLPVIAADGRRIPLRTGSADAAWCLGMLCTVRDKAAVLSEIHRVLKPGASLGLLVVVARDPQTLPAPDGNHFPTQRELLALLADAGFASGQITVQLIHAVSRSAGHPLKPRMEE
ncbi:class I SAM-dependent methyltransferase [Planotetraspora sp. GP83]|uniref:class I SAM-dependent methyltransferase n=1 Tax=Planotetraspora sp. GP83 TaxID=3156264 RepID=UPI0035150302